MIEYLKKSLEDYLIFFQRLNADVDPPKLIENSGVHQFRYAIENIQTLCLIKTGRVISSLNAIMILFESGYFVEIAVLLRGVKECHIDLIFLLEDYPGDTFTKAQEQYISEFFTEEIEDPSDPIKSARKHNRVSSKKIHAASARAYYKMSDFIKDPELRAKIKKYANPSDTQETTQKIHNMFSGYVHFGYSQSMDLIGVPPKYHLNGMLGTPRVSEWYDTLITEFDALYNLFLFLCSKFKYEKEFIELSKKQFDFRKVTGID